MIPASSASGFEARSPDLRGKLLSNKPRARLVELDILRGFLLLWMTFTHLPTKASTISNQTFGFVSGAEGFIFLAAFMVGQLEYRKEQRGGEMATVRDLTKRTARVYLYHGGLLVIAFTVFARIAVEFHRPAVENLLSFYLQAPRRAAVAAFLLQYRPSLLDILPMYVVFMAITPLARRMAHRWSWDLVIYLSFGIWAAAQFGLRAFIYRKINFFGLSVPENSIGAFDLYAWQLLWIVGLALGTIYAESLVEPAERSSPANEMHLRPWLLKLSLAVAMIFLVLRYSPVDHWMDANLLGWLIDKWHLGAARVINFAAITIVLVRFGSRLASLKIFAPLALLGQASLEVFSVHVLCCIAGDLLSHEADPQLPWLTQAVLLVFTVSLLFATALARKWWVEHRSLTQQLPAAPAGKI
jgi:hypothetical protein